MILHILLKTTLLLLFVTSLQAQISAFNCTSMLNEGPSRVGFRQQNNDNKTKQEHFFFFFFFFFNVKIGGAAYTALRPYRRQIR